MQVSPSLALPAPAAPHTTCLWGGPASCAHTPGQVGKPSRMGVNPAGQDWEAGYETKLVSCAKGEVDRSVEGKGEMGMRLGLGRYGTS